MGLEPTGQQLRNARLRTASRELFDYIRGQAEDAFRDCRSASEAGQRGPRKQAALQPGAADREETISGFFPSPSRATPEQVETTTAIILR